MEKYTDKQVFHENLINVFVWSLLVDQFLMGTHLLDFSLVHHNNTVSLHKRCDPVGNHNNRCFLHLFFQFFADLVVCLRIYCG